MRNLLDTIRMEEILRNLKPGQAVIIAIGLIIIGMYIMQMYSHYWQGKLAKLQHDNFEGGIK